MIKEIKILWHHGKQFIPDLTKAVVPYPFRGRPVLSSPGKEGKRIADICPTDAITEEPFQIDLGKCAFCGECEKAFPRIIRFTNDHKIACNTRQGLIIREGVDSPITIDRDTIRKEISGIFNRSLKLRQISAAGDNSSELECGACGNPNFDMGRLGIEFVASPRHADGVLITGPISENMAEATRICYHATPDPKIVILCGVDAISGGIFAESKALDRSFLTGIRVDLYIPGNPPHPLTIINGLLELTREKYRKK